MRIYQYINKGEIISNLIEISKEEMNWLIENNYIKNQNGKYIDLVVIGNKKKSRRKKRYTTEPIARNLCEMKLQK